MQSTTHAVDAATRGLVIRDRRVRAGVRAVAGVLLAVFMAVPTEATLRSVGTEFQIDSGTAAPVSGPALAMDSSGGVVVVWATGGKVIAQRYDRSGRALGGELVANTSTSGFHIRPAVATDAAGGFMIVWETFEPEPSDYVIRARRYDASGAPMGSEIQIDSAATDRQHQPAVAADSAGGFLVLWEGHNLEGAFVASSGIFARRYDGSGRPLGEEFQVNGAASNFAASPAMATDSAGNLVVVWAGDSASHHGIGIWGRRYDAAGVAVGGEFPISEPTGSWQSAPAVATDEAGGFVVVWRQAELFIGEVVGRRFDSGGMPAGDVFSVNAATDDYGYVSPTIAILAGGGFVVVSERDDLTRLFNGPGDIVLQQHLPGAEPLGGELGVNSAVVGHQGFPAVTADEAGNVVVVWMSLGGIESEAGIIGHRYTVSPLGEGSGCACDCNDDGRVTVAELIRGVTLVLTDAPVGECTALDADGDGHITIGDLVAGVNDALHGCVR